MFKQKILLSLVVATTMYGNSITLDTIKESNNRVNPSDTNQILSFNNSTKDAVHSIVNISTKKRVKNRTNPIEQMFQDPMFREFFGRGFGNGNKGTQRVQKSLGSGVILSKDGYIVTNAHVVENSDEIIVSIGENQTEYNAKLIGIDKDSDLAVIKIEAKNLKAIKVGTSNSLLIGDVVFAIGNPFGVGQTVTQGIISALNKNKVGINKYENFIQTDASINPGNSGGALIDSRGALIGINSAIMTRSGGNNGIGFAIPVSMVKDIVEKLVKDGKVTRGYLGVSIDDIDKELQGIYNHKEGALILNVSKDTPAYKFNLKRGDLVYAVNGKTIKDSQEFSTAIGSFSPKEKITLQIERNGKNIEIDIVLDSRDSLYEVSQNTPVLNGLFLSNITNENSTKYRIQKGIYGVLITDVKAQSEAEKVGFEAGDVIIQIENIEIENLNDVQKALKKFSGKQKRIYINRYGRILVSVIK
ncbi:MAG: Do family serine endopeptidase [Campylobacterota bacterium]|nr:Do family serine endopeptidase [Campylobacterota bacterium]